MRCSNLKLTLDFFFTRLGCVHGSATSSSTAAPSAIPISIVAWRVPKPPRISLLQPPSATLLLLLFLPQPLPEPQRPKPRSSSLLFLLLLQQPKQQPGSSIHLRSFPPPSQPKPPQLLRSRKSPTSASSLRQQPRSSSDDLQGSTQPARDDRKDDGRVQEAERGSSGHAWICA